MIWFKREKRMRQPDRKNKWRAIERESERERVRVRVRERERESERE